MALESLHLKKEFEIQKIASLHYFEYKSDFIFKSEYHDYWKLLYVEDGSAEITFSNKKLSPVILEKGDLFIQSPDEYYSFKAAPGKIAVLFTAGFYCDTQNPALLSNLSNKKFHCQKKEAERSCIWDGFPDHTWFCFRRMCGCLCRWNDSER